jgi:hypothetical protein
MNRHKQTSEPRAKACIRILSELPEIGFITKLMETAPSRYTIAGEKRSLRSVAAGKHSHSTWILESILSEKSPLEKHILYLLPFLEKADSKLKCSRDKICGVDIFCFYASASGQGSIELSSEILRRIALVDADLMFDLYLS